MKLFLSAALLACVANLAFTQGPCGALPLQMPLQFGNTSSQTAPGTPTGLPGCAFYGSNNSPEQWYAWTPAVDGTMLITTCQGAGLGAYANFDTSLAVYEGTSCSNLTYVACNGDGPAATCPFFQSSLTFNATCGTNYWIKVNGYEFWVGGPWAGDFGLASQFTPAAPAPDFQLALSASAGSLQVDLTGAPCGLLYFTAASFSSVNFVAGGVGNGWWFGLHVNVNDLVAQYQSGVPPFVGVVDGFGAATSSIAYPPVLSGMNIAAVSIVLDGLAAPLDTTTVVTTTL
jgi:hypothetical protein